VCFVAGDEVIGSCLESGGENGPVFDRKVKTRRRLESGGIGDQVGLLQQILAPPQVAGVDAVPANFVCGIKGCEADDRWFPPELKEVVVRSVGRGEKDIRVEEDAKRFRHGDGA
jgi:hypothetical protein